MQPAGRREAKIGKAPGTLVHVGERRVSEPTVRVVRYDSERFEEERLDELTECPETPDDEVTWIALTGLHEVEWVRRIGEAIGLHPLVIEDILDTQHRPKVEDFDEHLFCVLRYFPPRAGEHAHSRQISLVLTANAVISFEEEHTPELFDEVRRRIETARGRIRSMGADYLFYALIDAVIDSYFLALEGLGSEVEQLEDLVIERPEPEVLGRIHHVRARASGLRRAIWPLRDAVGRLERGESDLLTPELDVFLRDAYDHTVQIAETLEALRDTLMGMLDTYLSSLSNRMNEVMKVLTIIATIFIPITFIAGVYGMNFDWMPELHLRWGYPVALGLMAVVALAMVLYFRRVRWL